MPKFINFIIVKAKINRHHLNKIKDIHIFIAVNRFLDNILNN
jgi:hypothetical protein